MVQSYSAGELQEQLGKLLGKSRARHNEIATCGARRRGKVALDMGKESHHLHMAGGGIGFDGARQFHSGPGAMVQIEDDRMNQEFRDALHGLRRVNRLYGNADLMSGLLNL